MRKDNVAYKQFLGDIYVADYTEYFKTHPDKIGIGVAFSGVPFNDINSLYIANHRHIQVAAVNFEECKNLMKDNDGKTVTQCEGLCFAVRARKHGWVLLIELKYCMERNIGFNADKAIFQLKKTINYLRDERNVIETNDNVYWVLSMPDHSIAEPFVSFSYSQDDMLSLLKEYGVVMFFRRNKLQILTDSNLGILK